MMDNNLIIGLTGPFNCGCTTISKSLEKNGWVRFKLSDILREMCKGDRGKLQDQGNDLRKKDIEAGNNGGILIRKAFEKIKDKIDDNNIVLECIKNPSEIMELKKRPNAYLISINAFFSKRWERSKKKGEKDWGKFEATSERDKNENLITEYEGKSFYYGQEVQKCVDIADIAINNSINYKDEDRIDSVLFNKISHFIAILKSPKRMIPSQPELLMNNAYCTSLLSRCLKRQTGAIIVINDQYVISSGYNTVPFNETDCKVEYAGKCYRDKKFKEILDGIKFCPECGKSMLHSHSLDKSCTNAKCKYYDKKNFLKKSFIYGKGLDVCRALHAEESAILQSSHLGGGISLEGATLYTTTFPCMLCAKKIIDVRIKKIIYIEPYPMREAFDMLDKADVKIEQFEGVKAQSFFNLYKKYDI